MKRLLFLILVVLAVAVVFSYLNDLGNLGVLSKKQVDGRDPKREILRIALVADSHNENELLAKALRQAQGMGINWVIGLGDYTNLGTLEELRAAKDQFDGSKLEYYATAGDRDGWDSRNQGQETLANFKQVFGQASQVIEKEGIQFIILDNSDIYSGISQEDWKLVNQWVSVTSGLVNRRISESVDQNSESPTHRLTGSLEYRITDTPKLTFIFAHKTPFHPESKHVMGEDRRQVAKQADRLIKLIEEKKVDGFFAGDIHFFAQFKSPKNVVKITTIGAVASERNFAGPRFAILTVYDDYSWEVEDIEIR